MTAKTSWLDQIGNQISKIKGFNKTAGEEEDTTQPKNKPNKIEEGKTASNNFEHKLTKVSSDLADLLDKDTSIIQVPTVKTENDKDALNVDDNSVVEPIKSQENANAKGLEVGDNSVIEPLKSKEAAEDTTQPKNKPGMGDEGEEEGEEGSSDESEEGKSAADTTQPKNKPGNEDEDEEDDSEEGKSAADTTQPKNKPDAEEPAPQEEPTEIPSEETPEGDEEKTASIILSAMALNSAVKTAEAVDVINHIDKHYVMAKTAMPKVKDLFNNPLVKNIATGGIGVALGAGGAGIHYAEKHRQLAENTLGYLANDDMMDEIDKQKAYENGYNDGGYAGFGQMNQGMGSSKAANIASKAINGLKSVKNKVVDTNKAVADKVREKSVNLHTDKIHGMGEGKAKDIATQANRWVRDGSDLAVNSKAIGLPAGLAGAAGYAAFGGDDKGKKD